MVIDHKKVHSLLGGKDDGGGESARGGEVASFVGFLLLPPSRKPSARIRKVIGRESGKLCGKTVDE